MISRSQLFCILLLSRLSAEIVFPYSRDFSGVGLAALVAAEVIRFVLALPLLIYSLSGRDMYGAVSRKNKPFGVVFGLVSAVILAAFFVRTALYTAEFAQRTLLGGMSGAVLLVIVLAFAVYSAVKGAEAISRAGVLMLVAAVIVTVTVIIADIPHIRIRTAMPTDLDEGLVRCIIERLLSGGEYLVFAAMLPYVKPKDERSGGSGGTGFWFAAASLVSVLLIAVFCMGVLGEFFMVAEYPFIASSQLSDIVLFKRLDGFAGAVWSLGAAFRSGLLLFGVYAVLRACIPSRKKKENAI